MLTINIISLFPEFFEAFSSHSMMKRAIQQGRLAIDVINPRDFSHNKHGQVDDTPYGGGAGMLMMAPPLFESVEAALGMPLEEYKAKQDTKAISTQAVEGHAYPKRRIIFLGPTGERFTQAKAKKLATYDQLIFLCGHYEGIDHRVEDYVIDETISLGDFVVTGGELPAMVVIDAVARMIPGVLGATHGAMEDSFYEPVLECPQYTKPPLYRDLAVPAVLRSGHHKNIEEWRLEQALLRTHHLRPDLLERTLTDAEQKAWKRLEERGLV